MTSVSDLLARYVDDGTVPGAVAFVGDSTSEPVALGAAALDGRPLRADAIFRIQSMTKIVTAVAALRLVEAGRLQLDDSVVPWLPELADRQVLSSPDGPLDDTVSADRDITLRHLLTCSSGYGMTFDATPLQAAVSANRTAAGPDVPPDDANAWLRRLAELPLAFQPGEGWRYHHSFAVLGILISRVVGRPLHDHLVDDLLGPLGMVDTGFWVPDGQLDRLPAALRHTESGLVEIEPAGGGSQAGPPAFDVSHGDLVSTVDDFGRLLQALVGGGQLDGVRVLDPDRVAQLAQDQVPAGAKGDDSFYPGFWDETAWGWGTGIYTAPEITGRYGWSGGQGTTYWVDRDGTIGILLTQVELGERVNGLFDEFVHWPRPCEAG